MTISIYKSYSNSKNIYAEIREKNRLHSDGIIEFIAKVVALILSSRDAALSSENLHPSG